MLLQLVFTLTVSFIAMYYLGETTYWTVAVVAGIVVALLVWAVHIKNEGAPLWAEILMSTIVAALCGLFWPGLPIALSWGRVARRVGPRTEGPSTDESA